MERGHGGTGWSEEWRARGHSILFRITNCSAAITKIVRPEESNLYASVRIVLDTLDFLRVHHDFPFHRPGEGTRGILMKTTIIFIIHYKINM